MDKIVFWATYWLGRAFLRVFYGLRIYGTEHVLKTGSVIFAGNHMSNFDPLVLGVSIPRYSRFIAKKELFQNAIIGWYLRQLGAFPVDRAKADLEAMRTSIKVVKEGGALGIFPEGTRNKSGVLGKAQPGVVMIALKTKAPIIPCALTNSGSRPTIVRFGKPILLTEYYDRKLSKEEMEEIGEMMMREIGILLEMDRKFDQSHG